MQSVQINLLTISGHSKTKLNCDGYDEWKVECALQFNSIQLKSIRLRVRVTLHLRLYIQFAFDLFGRAVNASSAGCHHIVL